MADTTTETPIKDPGQARWDDRSELLNWAYITYRYHRKRQWFFDLCDKVTQAASVIVGLAVVSGKTVSDYLPVIGFAIAALGVLALVFGYSERKQSHRDIAEKARQLAGLIQPVRDADLTDDLIIQWEGMRTKIDILEPPNLKTLVAKCEWEQAIAEGHRNHVQCPPWWRQLHMHFF